MNKKAAEDIIINLLISILLINKYGIGGPIIGTLVAEFLFIFTFPYFCKLMNFNWLNYATIKLKITCINIPATIFFYWMQWRKFIHYLNFYIAG